VELWSTARRVAATFVCACLGLSSHVARAYTIQNELSHGCHEQITTDALRVVRGELPTAPPLPASENDQALIDDLQFTPPSDVADLGGATLLVGVRDNDLKGRSSDDLAQLAAVHGNPDAQQEHCLRSATEKEPTGSAAAVADCRAFVRSTIQAALAGLDDAGRPDPTKLTTVTVYLSIRGQVDAPLPTYYLKMGQAIHAIEDSFTHTYRSADETHITVVLNWIDKVDGTLVEARDGPAHATQLDRCDDPDAIRTTRRQLATLAAVGVLRATLDPQSTPDQKMTAADAVLDTYLSYSPGCTFDNGWCNAPERAYADAACGCHLGRSNGGGGGILAVGVAVLIGLGRRARWRRGAAVPACALALLGLVDPSAARAQSTTITRTTPATTPGGGATTEKVVTTPTTTTTTLTTPTVPDEHAPAPPRMVPVAEPGPLDPNATAWGAYLGGSGSINDAAVAGAAGLRLRANRSWSFGVDGEWNPWLAFNGSTVHAGAVNVYGTAILRLPLAYEQFNLRSTLNLGTSYLVSNLYGAPSGSVGAFAGLSFLGLEWKVSRAFLLIINPLSFAVPAPQLKNVPLFYPQYRMSLGVELYTG
jgi:hypothetical protein